LRDIFRLWERKEILAGLGCGNPKARGHLEEIGVDGRIILR